jgi:hypothetical protein
VLDDDDDDDADYVESVSYYTRGTMVQRQGHTMDDETSVR